MKINYSPDPVVKSLRRLVELSKILQRHNDADIYAGIKKESTILLRRTIKLWVAIRVGENWLPWRILNKINERKRRDAEDLLQEDDTEYYL